jgi:hypothetical protein
MAVSIAKCDDLSVPGNDPARFDCRRAARRSGEFRSVLIQGNSVVVRLGPPTTETFETTLPRGNTIVIRGLSYERQ